MTRNLTKSYINYLMRVVCDEYQYNNYRKLFEKLYFTQFRWQFDMDENRAVDGIGMRVDFCESKNIDIFEANNEIGGPCRLLEMMVGLAKRCEDNIMGDSLYGDRTRSWFWQQILSLGLMKEDDNRYNSFKVDVSIEKMLNRDYEPDGKGGLWWVPGVKNDMRQLDIWYQMHEYLKTIEEME